MIESFFPIEKGDMLKPYSRREDGGLHREKIGFLIRESFRGLGDRDTQRGGLFLLPFPEPFLSPEGLQADGDGFDVRSWMAEDIFYWLALSLVPGVGSTLFKRLLERFKTPEAVFRASAKELSAVEGWERRLSGPSRKGPFEKRVERELYLLEKVGGNILTSGDEGYPKRLKEIYDPPPVLYVRGELRKQDELAVSIVGKPKDISLREVVYGKGKPGTCSTGCDDCQRDGERN